MCAYVLNERAESLRADAVCIAEQMEAVEVRLSEAVASDVDAASEVALHLLDAGGKRVRPKLVLLSAGACGGDVEDPNVLDLAAAAELVHTASLVHDDVVDETIQRRGVPTANGRWGNRVSVLSGDYLLAKAFSLLASIGEMEVTAVLSNTAVRMTESEVLQAKCEGSIEEWQANYWRIIQGKTAAFTAACCECGAILAHSDEGVRSAVAGFGFNFGLAFQISDDLLDILGDPAQTGKDIGSDLTHGKFTLPFLLALQNSSRGDGARLMSLLKSGFLSEAEAQEAVAIVTKCGATGLAKKTAVEYADKARACLASIPDSDYTTALSAMAASVAGRAF